MQGMWVLVIHILLLITKFAIVDFISYLCKFFIYRY